MTARVTPIPSTVPVPDRTASFLPTLDSAASRRFLVRLEVLESEGIGAGEVAVDLLEGSLVKEDLDVPLRRYAEVVATGGAHLEVLGKLLAVENLPAPLALVEHVGWYVAPVLRLEGLFVFTKPGHHSSYATLAAIAMAIQDMKRKVPP